MADLSDHARFADAAEAAAFRELFAVAPPEFARAMRLQAIEIDAATALVAGAVPASFFNRVIGLGVLGPASQRSSIASPTPIAMPVPRSTGST